jgi:hypothetical protein
MLDGQRRTAAWRLGRGAWWLLLWVPWLVLAGEPAATVPSAWRPVAHPHGSAGAPTASAATAPAPNTIPRSVTESDMNPLPLNAEFAFTAAVKVSAPTVMGVGPDGLRRFIAITGGTAAGPAFTGNVLAGSGDWQIVRIDGVISLQARYTLESSDGVRIAITNTGLRDASPAVAERIARGDPVAASDYYFRTVAFIEAPVGSKYEWMNRRVFVGIAERKADAAVVHFYTLN